MTATSKPINIIIPMGGLGSRFANNGYKLPKPLVPILGRPMISWILGNLNIRKGDKVYIAIQREVDVKHGISKKINLEFSGEMDITFIYLKKLTRGAAETLYKVTKTLDEEDLRRPVISLDCDTIYFSDVLSAFRNLEPNEGCCAYFHDHGSKAIYSYIDLTEENGDIMNIKEKQKISNYANTGGYGFPNSNLLNKYIMVALHNIDNAPDEESRNKLLSNGEFYTSSLIQSMIQDEIVFKGIYIEHFDCVGTPTQLVNFFQSTLTRPDIIPESLEIVLDMPARGDTKDKSALDDSAIANLLGQETMDIYDRARALGFKMLLSFDDGSSVESHRFNFASTQQRKEALKHEQLFSIDKDIQKTVGWYL